MKFQAMNPVLPRARRTARLFRGALLAAALVLPPCVASAQAPQGYPNRPVRLILPGPPGTLTDLIPRAIQPAIEQRMNQRLVVEHRPGAAGIIGTETVAKAAPDGYTLLIAVTNFVAINQFIYPKLPYDPVADLVPVSLIVDVPMVVYAHPSLPGDTLKALVDHARANPGKLNYASAGSGTTPHLAMEIMMRAAGMQMVHVPFKGGTPGVNALVANEVQLMMTGFATAAGQIRGGKAKPIAVVSRSRIPPLPDTPTFAESGFGALQSAIPGTWWGLLAPRGTDPQIVRRWSAEISAAMADPATRKRYEDVGLTPVGSTPEEFATLIADESRKWEQVVRTLNLKAQ